MKKQAYRTKPGELELRIGKDGRVYMLAADEALLDVLEAVMPDDPLVLKRRKAKTRARNAHVRAAARSKT